MPWIQNVALADIPKGHHIRVDENSVLIQIVDPCMEFPTPLYKFGSVHQFEFLDLEKNDPWGEEFKINDHQAKSLVLILKQALLNNSDVVVHCHAGVCRSGAVAEIGVMMGFQDAEAFRSPNLLVKHKMMEYLGWTYDENEKHSINGIELTESGLIIPKKAREGDI